jgi:hypothetical protein
MSSQRRKDASRANGARSRGPITPEGLDRCRNASITHGLTARRTIVLETESKDEFATLFDAYLDYFQPANVVEHSFVLQLVTAQWRMDRAAALETALLDLEVDRQEPKIKQEFEVCDKGTRLAIAYRALCDDSRVLTTLNRYEARHTRTFHRALKALENRPVHKGPSSENGHSGPLPSEPAPAGQSEDTPGCHREKIAGTLRAGSCETIRGRSGLPARNQHFAATPGASPAIVSQLPLPAIAGPPAPPPAPALAGNFPAPPLVYPSTHAAIRRPIAIGAQPDSHPARNLRGLVRLPRLCAHGRRASAQAVTAMLAAFFGPALGVASYGLRRFLDLKAPLLSSALAQRLNLMAGGLFTAMVLVQLAVVYSVPGQRPSPEIKAVWLALDVAWDAYFGLATLCFALAMLNHPRFGRLFGISGIVIAAALLALNLATFPSPPVNAGLLDIGPLSGLWYLFVMLRMWASLSWARGAAS